MARERVEHLIRQLDAAGAKALIPTPVLSEVLVNAGTATSAYLDLLAKSSCLQVADFDQRAAVELAAVVRQAIADGNLRGGSGSPRQKIKVDRQIVATARVNRVSIIYSDDADVARFGQRAGMRVVTTAELPVPPERAQGELPWPG